MPAYRSAPAQQAAASFGDLKWFEVFKDEKLQALIKEALQKNYNAQIAAQRVLAAREQITIAKAPIFPQIFGEGSLNRQSGLRVNTNTAFGGGGASWELDIWGKIRKATEAARAEYLSQEEIRNGVIQTLITDLASAYFRLLEADQALAASRSSLKSREASLRLVEARLQGGVATRLEVDQAKTLVDTAKAQIADLERFQEQLENAISELLGRVPGPVERGKPLTEFALDGVVVPAGLPSSLLERRPDIRQAEQALIAANARVGVAKASMFPSINLTISGGYQSGEITSLFSASGTGFAWGGSVVAPIFNGGQLWANYKSSKYVREAAILGYQQSILNAFRDTSDSLIGYQKAREYLTHNENLVKTYRDQLQLATLRYRGGVTSYLEVLDTERYALDAEINYASAYRQELDSVVRLYKALGGGWQQP